MKRWLPGAVGLALLALILLSWNEVSLHGCLAGTSHQGWVLFRADEVGRDGDCAGAFARNETVRVVLANTERCRGCALLWSLDEVPETRRQGVTVNGKLRLAVWGTPHLEIVAADVLPVR